MFFSPLPLLVIPVGIYLLFKLRFFYLLHPVRSFGRAFLALRDRKNLTAFTLALAGTLGVGNVLGVAAGLIVGGPGSIFWMFISAPIASALKYSEVALCAEKGGSMYHALRDSHGALGRPLSSLYALGCLFLSLVMGAALQVRSISDTAQLAIGAPSFTVALAAVAVVLISILIGGDKIGKITVIVIPLTTIIYILVAFTAIFAKIDYLPEVISVIVNSALCLRSGVGGVLAVLSSRALSEGVARGMLSNEAGAGTSTLAHATGESIDPAVRGLHGALEVVFDTSLLCTLTGLAILLFVPDLSGYTSGMELVCSAFSASLGESSVLVIALSVFAFGYATVISWYYYGRESLRQLAGKRVDAAFVPLFLGFVALGTQIKEAYLIAVSDVLFLILSMLTLATLIKNSDRIVALSESCGFLKSKESYPRKRSNADVGKLP